MAMNEQDGEEVGESTTCDKLIVATGLTSKPSPINIRGSENVQRPIVQFASLPKKSHRLLNDPSIQNVTVFGSGKVTYDAVYLFATAGKRVTWIIRKSGHGPHLMAPSHLQTGPFRCWVEKLVSTRFMSWFSPCV